MKTPQTNDSLAKAVACLGAVEVAPGQYAVPRGVNPWACCPTAALAAFDSYPDFSAWYEARGDVADAPSWWSPEQRFAWALDRKTGNKREAFDGTQDEGIKALSRLACHITNGLPRGRKRITADLTTGAEVPACD